MPFDHIYANKISNVVRYVKIPETNPNFFIKPYGLEIDKEFWFDKKGLLVKTINYNGIAVTSDKYAVDITDIYTYENERVSKVVRIEIDTFLINYLYSDCGTKVIKITKKNSEDITKIEIEKYNSENQMVIKETLTFSDWSQNSSYLYKIKSEFNMISKFRKIERQTSERYIIDNCFLKKFNSVSEICDFEKMIIAIEERLIRNGSHEKHLIKYFLNSNGQVLRKKERNRDTKYYYNTNFYIERKTIDENDIYYEYSFKYFD